MNAWSQWLNYWLQKLKCHVPTYVKDSQQVLDDLLELILPEGMLRVSCHANLM